MAFPNPTANTTTILYNATFSQTGKATWFLTNTIGQIVAQNNLELQEDGNLITLDLKALPSGIYVFYIQGEDFTSETRRIVRR